VAPYKLQRSAGVPVEIETAKDASKRFQYVRKLLNDFWKRFSSHYLNEIRQSNLYRKQNKADTRKLVVGDIVLIRDDEPLPRNRWKIGKILELVKGKDGNVRGAKLMTISNEQKTTCYRPVQKLIPFEIKNEETTETFDGKDDSNASKSSEKIEEKQKYKGRKAKQLGQYERRLRQRYY